MSLYQLKKKDSKFIKKNFKILAPGVFVSYTFSAFGNVQLWGKARSFTQKQSRITCCNKQGSGRISEKRSRDWRFRCLARLYIANKYRVLVTGHTATDRAETALLQLIRGTSLQGISSFRSNKIYKSIYPQYYNYSNFF